jgi:hypothetical protein
MEIYLCSHFCVPTNTTVQLNVPAIGDGGGFVIHCVSIRYISSSVRCG